MTSLQSRIERIFASYIDYLNVDLAHSLIDKTKFSRNMNIFVFFRDIFLMLLNPAYVDSDEAENDYSLAFTPFCTRQNPPKCLQKLGSKKLCASLFILLMIAKRV